MPVRIENKSMCTACGACSNICPQNCILMKNDASGFQYPDVDLNKCIDCGLCVSRCPVLKNDRPDNLKIPLVYAARTKNEEDRFTSTSGGIFTELAKTVIRQGGFVAGARYNESNMVEHCLIDKIDDIHTIRQSKYIQSNIGFLYRDIKEKITKGNMVAFCGAPCQVAGLYQYLGKKLDNLVTFDFICRGMNSPKAYYYWLKELEEQNGSRVDRVWFKYKVNGWKRSPRCTRVDFKNGQYKVYDGSDNLFMCGYLGPNLYIRPSCGDCRFKGTPRIGDITLADFWGLQSELEDDGGTSMVMINNEKGKQLFEAIRENILFEEHAFSETIAGNVCQADSVRINARSEQFLQELGTKPFSVLIQRYGKASFKRRCVNRLKKWLHMS